LGEVYFVSVPIGAELEGGNVRVTARSGDREFVFELPANVFLATFAGFAVTAHQWRGGKAEVVELHAASS